MSNGAFKIGNIILKHIMFFESFNEILFIFRFLNKSQYILRLHHQTYFNGFDLRLS